MSKELNVIVDRNDNIIGAKSREEIKPEDIYRVSALWVVNKEGKILLARRAYTKKNDPGKWGPAVAGTVTEGESYEQNIRKEAEEEIGLIDYDFGKGIRRFSDGAHKYFSKVFLAVLDWEEKDFKIQEEEVVEVKWFTREEIERVLKEAPEEFIPTMKNRMGFMYPKGQLIDFEELGE